jgi:hypothetical protein
MLDLNKIFIFITLNIYSIGCFLVKYTVLKEIYFLFSKPLKFYFNFKLNMRVLLSVWRSNSNYSMEFH